MGRQLERALREGEAEDDIAEAFDAAGEPTLEGGQRLREGR
jgi:hypothetical protein